MLNQIDILDFAIKGVNADIEKLEQSIKKGRNLLKEYENGVTFKTKKTPYEIQEVIQKKKAEIEDLKQIENELQWQLLELKDEFQA